METQARYRAVIVDDEELARQVLSELLRAHPEIEVVAECANGFEAVKALTELKPDLLFLDVQMPKLDGFEVLELAGPVPAVIFVTAYDQFALRAFEAHAVDYLLKPFGAGRLKTAVEHARQRLAKAPPPGAQSGPELRVYELAAAARPPEQYLERLVVRDGSKVILIPVGKLDYAEAQDDYVALCTEGKKHLKQQTISSLEKVLDPKRFLRIHRSYIVNLERVSRIEPYGKDTHVVVLPTGAQLPVSRSGYARLREVLGT
ncbi:MAG TPA: LytTR family transcriptional regulator DNA-binding domain-containing protein [Terriglobia bacterium]|nr:LytTR family transcriptional regulator DNA-binding domain-containing protein [Terriglobia bacterium]